jgi:hypothetical protein
MMLPVPDIRLVQPKTLKKLSSLLTELDDRSRKGEARDTNAWDRVVLSAGEEAAAFTDRTETKLPLGPV